MVTQIPQHSIFYSGIFYLIRQQKTTGIHNFRFRLTDLDTKDLKYNESLMEKTRATGG